MPAILLIGEDDFLLETRAAVLRETGAETVRSTVGDALPQLQARRFNVVILCHSIPEHLSETLAVLIRQNWPATEILQISATRDYEECTGDGVTVSSATPERLIATVVSLLGRRPPLKDHASASSRLRLVR